MKYFVSIDGGGTKIEAVVFDEALNMLSTATSGSVNPNFSTQEVILRNLHLCFTHLFKDLDIPKIDCLYVAFVGNLRQMVEILREYLPVEEVKEIGEYPLGLYAAGLHKQGVVALSGTGSGVFYVNENGTGYGLGGWGALVSEEGSGYYLGRLAVMAAIHAYEKRGEPTILVELIAQHYGYEDFRKAVFSIYEGGAQVRSIASLAHVVCEAARRKDKIALKVLRENGLLMADQTKAVLRNAQVPDYVPIRVIGGGFKSHIAMYNAFKEDVLKEFPGRDIQPPLFEPVVGNIIRYLYERDGQLSSADLELLKENFSPFLYKIKS